MGTVSVGVLVATLGVLVLAGHLAKPTGPILAIYTSPRLLEFAAGAVIGHFWICGVLRVKLLVSVAWIGLGIWLLAMVGELRDFSPMEGAVLIVGGA
jgi:peptidoglycan/LPS O-acetylase OafA/YrhL